MIGFSALPSIYILQCIQTQYTVMPPPLLEVQRESYGTQSVARELHRTSDDIYMILSDSHGRAAEARRDERSEYKDAGPPCPRCLMAALRAEQPPTTVLLLACTAALRSYALLFVLSPSLRHASSLHDGVERCCSWPETDKPEPRTLAVFGNTKPDPTTPLVRRRGPSCDLGP